ncbi:hypothetical protein OG379_32420 [Streptomyces sp. NBC_01166]|uniref:hypothetical protein n=1 Tax=Streptomyces sp. NBC_01166 TaxID=2903755 RepID=UPI0038676405|nr:hypothetical protein OG379_32420 [Streptomyces sp. NBC_01166]
MGNREWRALIGTVSAGALCWGVAGAVHMRFFYHSNGGRAGGWNLPEGGGWYEFAMTAGFIVTMYSVPGLLRRSEWWPALSLSIGAAVGAVSVLTLGQGRRYWVAASVMTLMGAAAPLVNRLWGRHHPIRSLVGAPTD